MPLDPVTCPQCGKELSSIIYDFAANLDNCYLPEDYVDSFETTCSCGRAHIIQVEIKFGIKGDPR